jgi:surfactin synthase thioesterase subunit
VQDSKELIEKVIAKHDFKGKLIFFGLSLGGHIAMKTAQQLKVDVIIADRTFSSIPSVVKTNNGRFAGNLTSIVMDKDNQMKDSHQVWT